MIHKAGFRLNFHSFKIYYEIKEHDNTFMVAKEKR